MVVAGGGLGLGEELALGDGKLQAGLQHAKARLPQREVLPEGTIHQAVQRGVIEDVPPTRQVRRHAADLGVRGVDPMGGDGGRGGLIVGPHLEAVPHVFERTGTAAGDQRPGGQPPRPPAKLAVLAT